jgi:hypothetical protein
MSIHPAKMCMSVLLCLVFLVTAFGQQEQKANNTKKSCGEFVARFYAWYLRLPVKQKQIPKSEAALKARPYLFSDELLRDLREDSNAQEKAGSDLVSLDADPFLGTNGPFERYAVETITTKDATCWVEVHGVLDGKESETPDVTPELLLKNGRWRFINFYYPGPSDPKASNLLNALKVGRELRTKYGPKTNKR